VKLQAGDVLVLEAGPSFIAKSAENDRSFALLAEVEDSAPPRLSLLIPALAIAALMLVVYTAGLTSFLVSALVASIFMIFLGILSEQEARHAVNWDIFITAEAMANFLVNVGTAVGIGDAGLVGAVYFATFLISNVVTNNAATALLFPIAMDAAEKTGTDVILMSYSLMLGASARFMSPFGYTTNLLIYGPGGYKYKYFLAFGSPMQIVLWVLSTASLTVIKPWYISWIATSAVLALVVFGRMIHSSSRHDAGSSEKENL
jgi:di/tricarboxylate transporter